VRAAKATEIDSAKAGSLFFRAMLASMGD